nr:MAG TPA: hypothetical protein [Caudoviricetes sp.]
MLILTPQNYSAIIFPFLDFLRLRELFTQRLSF